MGGYFSLLELFEGGLVVEYDFEEDGLLDPFVVVELRQSQEEGRDEVVEDFIVVLFLSSCSEATIYRHLYFNY